MHSEEKRILLNEQEAEAHNHRQAKGSQYRDVKPRNDGVGGAAGAQKHEESRGFISREATLKVVEASRTLVF